jgi:predicted ABC-type sugar transport system permease subunit
VIKIAEALRYLKEIISNRNPVEVLITLAILVLIWFILTATNLTGESLAVLINSLEETRAERHMILDEN